MTVEQISNRIHKSILISHVDLDGIAPIILAIYFNDYFNEIEMRDYGDFDNLEVQDEFLKKDYQHICLTDYSFPKNFLERILANRRVQVEIYDHHETSSYMKEMDYPNLTVFHDIERCGTRLYFEEKLKKFYSRIPLIINQFVDRVDTYDIWRTDTELWEEALNLNRVYYGMKPYGEKDNLKGSLDFISSTLDKFDRFDDWKWKDNEKAKIDKAIQMEEKAYQDAKKIFQIRKDTRGLTFGLTKMGSKISIASMRFLKENPNLDYIVVLNTYNPDKLGVSYRSEKIDCTEALFVNGHPGAAGGSLPNAIYWDLFWKGTINSLPWNNEYVDIETGKIISVNNIKRRGQ